MGTQTTFLSARSRQRRGRQATWKEVSAPTFQKADADAAGFDRLLCYFDVGGLSRADALASLTLFAEKVMPHLGAPGGK